MTPLERASQALQKAADEKNRRRLQDERQYLVGTIGKDLVREIAPAMEQMVRDNGIALNRAIDSIKHVKMPAVVIPDINVPEPRVDVQVDLSSLKIPTPQITVNPNVRLPDIKFPETQTIEGWVKLQGVSMEKPLPVTLRNADGSPMVFTGGGAVIGGGSSGKADFFTIKGFSQSAFSELTNPDGRVKVELPTGSAGLTDTELRATSLPVEQVSGSAWTVYVKEIFGSTATDLINPDGRVKVELPSGASGLTDTELRASHIDVQQVSGAVDSVSVIGTVPVSGTFWQATQPVSGTVAVSGINNSVSVSLLNGDGATLDPRDRNWTISETVPVSGTFYQATQPVSGTVAVSGITNTVASANVDSTGVQYSGSNPFPVNLISQSLASSASALVDSTGVQYSGSNQFPVTVNGATNSVVAVGATLHGVADIGSAPQKVGGIVMTANPTAEVGGDVSNFRADDIGRQLMRPVQVRDLTVTAYASFATGTEATLLAASAGSFHDLIYILASNNSTAAVGIDIRPVTAGNIAMHLEIPANGTVGVAAPVPIPQSSSDTGNNWTVDLPDITGTTVYVSGLFSREV